MIDYYWWYKRVVVSSECIECYELMHEKSFEGAKKTRTMCNVKLHVDDSRHAGELSDYPPKLGSE